MEEGRSGARDSEGGRRTGAAGASDDGSSDAGAVELSLQLRTGSSAAAEEKEEKKAAPAARRSMTIFYNGRVCAADVTEHQACAIISMVNQEIFTQQQQRRDHGRHHQDSSGDGGHQNPTPAAALRVAHCHAAPSSHQVLPEAAAPPPLISHAAAGLSMKRSLQRFLQKRKTRAAAVASRYAGARPDQPTKP